MEDTVKRIINAVRNCRLFRPMTFEEAKHICRALNEPMVRDNTRVLKTALDHNDYRTAARQLIRMAWYARRFCLSRASLLLHFRLLVGKSQERLAIIAGCFDVNFELMIALHQDDEPSPETKSPSDT
jgi:hypothetical protein